MRRFCTGTEGGDLRAWHGSVASTNYSIAASTTRVRSGTYSLRATRTVTAYSPTATLNAAIINTTSTTVDYDSTGDPFTVNDTIQIDTEIMRVNIIDPTDVGSREGRLTVTRGFAGSVAATHSAGAAINKAFSGNGAAVDFSATTGLNAGVIAGSRGDQQALIPSGTPTASSFECWLRFYIWIEAAALGNYSLDMVTMTAAGSTQMALALTTGGVLQLRNAFGSARTLFTPSLSTWYRVVMHGMKQSSANGKCEIHVFAEDTNTLLGAAGGEFSPSVIDAVEFGMQPLAAALLVGGGQPDWYFDDIAINDAQNAADANDIGIGCPPPGAVTQFKVPTGELGGGTQDFIPSTGSDNSANVDEWTATVAYDAAAVTAEYNETPAGTAAYRDELVLGTTSTGSTAYANAITLTVNIPAANAAYGAGITLAEDLDTSETAVDVSSDTDVEAGDIIQVVGSRELMKVTAKAANTLTVVRAVAGTTATQHVSGNTVQQAASAFTYTSAGDDAAVGHCILVDSEQMRVLTEDTTNKILGVTRAVNRTTAAAHAASAAVTRQSNVTCAQVLFAAQDSPGQEGFDHNGGLKSTDGGDMQAKNVWETVGGGGVEKIFGVCLGYGQTDGRQWTNADFDAASFVYTRLTDLATSQKRIYGVCIEVEEDEGISLPNYFTKAKARGSII